MILRLATCLAFLCPAVAAALALDLPPQARLEAETEEIGADTPVPFAAWGGFEPMEIRRKGTITRRAWRIGSTSLTPLQILDPLRAQLEAAGFDIAFECVDATCGGFEFRFALDLIGEPDMHVDLGDFRYIAATRGQGDEVETIALVASRSSNAGFLHVTQVLPGDAPAARPVAADRTDPPATSSDLIASLEAQGRAVLDGLTFGTGSADLEGGPFASLQTLAEYLVARPEVTIVLVGHTDATGPLDVNTALSRGRAASVLDRLATAYGIARDRMQSDGVGFLMPLARNDTEDGRRLNRRVEVVLTGTN